MPAKNPVDKNVANEHGKQGGVSVWTFLKSGQPEENSASRFENHSFQFWVRVAFFCVSIVFGFIQAWDNRNTMNADGIAYLDMADAYLRGGCTMLINGHWSPFYPWLLSVALFLAKPSAYWEFAIVHLVNFVIYLFALIAFDFLLRELIADQNRHDDAGNVRQELPPWALMTVGYLTFVWSSLTFITMERKSPDMLMAVFVYLATAVILRIRRKSANWRLFVCLGVILGAGYLAKAPMFPLAFVFLGTAVFVSGKSRKTIPLTLLAFLVFVAVSGPFIFALSHVKGRFTFGDSAKLNYFWYINGAGPVWYLQDLGTGRGKFQHPPRRIFDFPPIYDFAAQVRGTQPSWYDPSYWIEGAVPHFDPRRQLSALAKNVGVYSTILFIDGASLLAVFLTLCWWGNTRECLKGIGEQWPILVPALAGLGMYAPVLVERRYVAVFVTIFSIGLFSGLRLRPTKESKKLAVSATLALLAAVGAPLAFAAAHDFQEGLRQRPHPQWEVAEGLRRMGIKPGDVVGRVGGTFGADWARLLRVRVVAEIPRDQAENFWSAGPAVQAQVIESFGKTGATAIVAQQIPPFEVFAPTPGWERIGKGNFYVFLRHRQSEAVGQPR